MIGGVCGGLGDYFGIDPVILRIAFIILTFVGGGGVLTYLVLWIVIPRDTVAAGKRASLNERVHEVVEEVRARTHTPEPAATETDATTHAAYEVYEVRRTFIGSLIVLAGVLVLAHMIAPFPWLQWHYAWPLALLVVGAFVIRGRRS